MPCVSRDRQSIHLLRLFQLETIWFFVLKRYDVVILGEIVCSILKNFLIDEANLGKAAGRYFGVKHVVLYLSHIWGIPPKSSMAPI